MIKVTVAIPIHNNEGSMERCIDSVMNQTIDQNSIELICVNNGSTDSSREILDRYAGQYSNVKVIHQKYSGAPGGPRNKALDKAKGEYIFFADPTDFLGEEALERMLAIGEKHFCDIVIGKYKGFDEEPDNEVFQRNPEFFTFFGSNVMMSLNAHKLFKVSLLRTQKLRFLEHTTLGEDHAITAPAYISSAGIGLVKDYDCYYITESGKAISLTRQETSFEQVHQSIKETFSVITRLNREHKAIKKGLYHYWERLLDMEVEEEVNRQISITQKIENFRDLSILAADYNPGEYFSLFTPVQKTKFRILEKDSLSDFQDYIRSEELQQDFVIKHGGLYPENEMAFKIAIDEAIDFSGYNVLVSKINKSYINRRTLYLEGHQYQSRLSPERQELSLRVLRRDNNEVYRVEVKEGLLSDSKSSPMIQVPQGKENQCYFHAEIELPSLSDITCLTNYDFSLVCKVTDYTVEALMGVDENYFIQMPYFIYDTYRNLYREATPIKNENGSFSLEVSQLDNLFEGLKITKAIFRVEKGLLRTVFEFETVYLSFIEGANEIYFSIDDFLISPILKNIVFNNGMSKLYTEYDISKVEEEKLLNNKKFVLVLDGIHLPVEKVEWEA